MIVSKYVREFPTKPSPGCDDHDPISRCYSGALLNTDVNPTNRLQLITLTCGGDAYPLSKVAFPRAHHSLFLKRVPAMTRIIYGYSGEGSGHSARAREMAACLIDAGHDVRLASYDRGFDNLSKEFDVIEIEGLTISAEENRVSLLKTITENLKRLPAGNRSLWKLRDIFQEFEPDVVITDFEPLTAYLAKYFDIALITIDNKHRMRYVEYEVPPDGDTEAKLIRRLIQMMVPWPSVSLITSITPGKLTNDRSFVFPPLVGDDIRELRCSDEGHILVYLTSGFDSLLPILKTYSRERFIVYGYDKEQADDNLTFQRASRDGFINHLAGCKAVIATAGFTLISEALYIGKPYLAMPTSGQFEQELNAWQLSQNGWGAAMNELNNTAIGDFLYRLPDYREHLKKYDRDVALGIRKKLLELVADRGALATEYKRRRETA